MKFSKPWILVAAAVCSQVAHADTTSDNEQDNVYLRCLIKRKVQPPEIPKEDSEFCLQEAGVADPGDDARKNAGKAWRDCLVSHAARLDDGVSPARDIGQATIALCPDEWRGYASTFWLAPSAKRLFVNGVSKYAVGEGVQAVLLTRSVMREKPQKYGMRKVADTKTPTPEELARQIALAHGQISVLGMALQALLKHHPNPDGVAATLHESYEQSLSRALGRPFPDAFLDGMKTARDLFVLG